MLETWARLWEKCIGLWGTVFYVPVDDYMQHIFLLGVGERLHFFLKCCNSGYWILDGMIKHFWK